MILLFVWKIIFSDDTYSQWGWRLDIAQIDLYQCIIFLLFHSWCVAHEYFIFSRYVSSAFESTLSLSTRGIMDSFFGSCCPTFWFSDTGIPCSDSDDYRTYPRPYAPRPYSRTSQRTQKTYAARWTVFYSRGWWVIERALIVRFRKFYKSCCCQHLAYCLVD